MVQEKYQPFLISKTSAKTKMENSTDFDVKMLKDLKFLHKRNIYYIIIISINCHGHVFFRTQTKRTLGEETFQREIMGGLINGIKDNNNDNDQ